ncbi:hypothetical protein HDV04_004020 [Boothiomyces sp. JEL0838]|nr:hypothetical protein HDV04_004020 [Boothiomyces sp. JEL0838]
MSDELLVANNATRVRSRDMFMLVALWMELFPQPKAKTLYGVRPTGCVLVDSRDRILSLQCTGESHSIVKAILSSPVDPIGCDMCTKMMVQAGIRKIYYFPAKEWEMDWDNYCLMQEQFESPDSEIDQESLNFRIQEKKDSNLQSVQRLVSNNPIAMTRFIPTWSETNTFISPCTSPVAGGFADDPLWELDESIANIPQLYKQYPALAANFDKTVQAVAYLKRKYQKIPKHINQDIPLENVEIYQHAIVLAHIAAKRTDDPKVGVG